MESYIIRIYRKDSGSSNAITGFILKSDDPNDEHIFRTMSELWNILTNDQDIEISKNLQ